MKTHIVVVLGVILALGCARVKVEAPKEPIKVDISMRLDIYQHVEKDINAIENIVSGSKQEQKTGDSHSALDYFISSAYAEEGLSPEVEQAALRRKDRYAELNSWEAKGVVGEDKSGLAQIIKPAEANPALDQLIKGENSDRMVIYREIAKKNGTSVEDVQKLYAKRLQSDAPAGTPIEVLNAEATNFQWLIKK